MNGKFWLQIFHSFNKYCFSLSAFHFSCTTITIGTSLVAQTVKASAYNAGDPGLIPESGRSPGEGNSYPLRYSCLENPIDRGAWWATIHGVTKETHTYLPSVLSMAICNVVLFLLLHTSLAYMTPYPLYFLLSLFLLPFRLLSRCFCFFTINIKYISVVLLLTATESYK